MRPCVICHTHCRNWTDSTVAESQSTHHRGEWLQATQAVCVTGRHCRGAARSQASIERSAKAGFFGKVHCNMRTVTQPEQERTLTVSLSSAGCALCSRSAHSVSSSFTPAGRVVTQSDCLNNEQSCSLTHDMTSNAYTVAYRDQV